MRSTSGLGQCSRPLAIQPLTARNTVLPPHCSSGFARRCIRLPARKKQGRQSCCPAIQAAQIKPAYNKYRSRYDIDQDYIKRWKEVTARDSQPKHVTPWSFLWFVPLFIKYHVIPGQIRYAWWLVWSAMLVARYQIRKRLILQGAKLDVQLMKASKQVEAPTFSCSLVLQRLHGHVSLLDTLKYRLQLLQGQSKQQ
ncbi:hypothetical protein WJX79_008249 [Trebouxia sp. C0005]